ncbi:MAG TPA: tetratricopeptide repeat protein [Thermoanaerobaculia bacterium]|nr:tetratricopeptide repeat protein [Thermoanaerobaculia bacterium]
MKIHPSGFVLEEFLLSLSNEHLSVVDHLIQCPACQEQVRAMRHRYPGPVAKKLAEVLGWPGDPARYSEPIRKSEDVAEGYLALLKEERAAAPGLYVELVKHPSEQRELLLKNSPRFHTWGVFELLVERSLETTPRDPAYGEELGLLALRLSEFLDTGLYKTGLIEDLRARAWAHVGNACRVRSDLQGAEEAFIAAYRHLRAGTKDPLERAILLDLEASLRRDQRRFDAAFRLLRRAVKIFRQSDQHHRAGRSLVNMSTVHHYEGHPERGIPMLYEALGFIDPEQEPRLLLCAKHNLADYLSSAGSFLEAQKIYRETRPLYRSFSDAWTQNRRKWVKGKIVRGLGLADQAESLFLAARDGFIAEGIPYDTALVSMELATLYAEQRRTADLKKLAGEMVPIFSSLNIHREALAALAYLKQAAEAERASLEVVRRVADYLRRAQNDPALRFEGAGE